MTEIVAAHLERVAQQARELAKALEPHLGDAEWYTEESAVETIAEFLAAALAACAREARLEQAEESEQALLAARKFVRGRHSVLTFGPRVLLEQLDLALLRITKMRLEVTGERAAGEKA